MASVSVREFGVLADGTPVRLWMVRDGGAEATFTDYGARLVSLTAEDAAGTYGGVVLGFATLEEYVADTTYQGATIGRYGNRIRHGRFTLDGTAYRIPANNGENALHGGPEGFDRRVWQGEATEDGVVFRLVSADGDQGFPGTLTVEVRFGFKGGELRIEYVATTDMATVLNLTNHAYFNLGGALSGTIVDHEIAILADYFTPVDAGLIPTGELRPVEGTVFDWRQILPIREGIDDPDEQLERAGGWDHNWVLGRAGEMKRAAELWDPASGRSVLVDTTEPGIQFYSGNFLDGSNGYGRRTGLCLETQHYPDSVNRLEWPTTVLRPGETMRSATVYKFEVA